MTILTLPTLSRVAPENFTFELQSNTHTFGAAPFSGEIQTIEYPGARWQGSFDWTDLNENDAALWQAFLVSLRGQAGRFSMYNLARQTLRRGTLGILASPAVNPSITGITSSVRFKADGFVPNVGIVLSAGDMVGINGELKMVMGDVGSNDTGEATFTVEPPMRVMPVTGTPVIVTQPTATCMLTEDKVGWTTKPPVLTDSSFQFAEVF